MPLMKSRSGRARGGPCGIEEGSGRVALAKQVFTDDYALARELRSLLRPHCRR